MLSTDKQTNRQTDRQTDRQTNQRYQKHNLHCQGGNYEWILIKLSVLLCNDTRNN